MATARDRPNQNLCRRCRGGRAIEVPRKLSPSGEVHAARGGVARLAELVGVTQPAGCSSAQHLSRPPLLRCGPVPTAEELSRTLATSAAMPASPPTQRRHPRSVAGAVLPSRPANGRWRSGDKANPDAAYDPELFRREILPRLALVKLSEIAEAAGCSKAYASDIRRGKWTPHVSTWGALSELAGTLAG
jgi:hypothetical protein